ncbi:hypothetical protein [Leptospira ilyithenensis]|uniref:PilZ domain-containing protein n=1 Tax=Leptospira ilyithenensis TaxID=2484901 RepID=A0A4R9LQV5_9LEPT|nr:hypothetical protein [Leptospira ilyithenensis]TGN10181.1 hypothetical protein EHS11_10475 [Leptospira ilyithenensis]
MKKYRLTDQRTVLGILSKLASTTLTDPVSQKKYQMVNPITVNDILKSVHFTLVSGEPLTDKPSSLVCVLKENRLELKVKLANPYLEDLFQVTEALIEPLERSSKRAAIDSITTHKIMMAPTADIGTIISLYGKTSLINQILNQWQVHLEQSLTNYGYFIKRVNIGFFYAADTPLMEALATSKAPYYLRDSNRKIFYMENTFFSPKKLNDQYVKSILDNHLLNNIKSVLIVPFFSTSKVLLGYFEVLSNLPDLGNAALQDAITGPQGIGPLLEYLDARAEEFVFQMEFAYAKDWTQIAEQGMIRDISQDGAGIGIYIKDKESIETKTVGSPISFQIEINSLPYTFYGSLRSIKTASSDSENHSIGVQIFQCDREEGMSLLASYASTLIGKEVT